MSRITPTVTAEMIEQGRKAREGHYLRVSPVGCTCGWKSDAYIEADGLPRLEAHLVELALEAAAPLIAAQAKAEALRELRDYLAEPRRVWFGDMGVHVALDIGDPRSLLALSAYLDLRADQIEAGR